LFIISLSTKKIEKKKKKKTYLMSLECGLRHVKFYQPIELNDFERKIKSISLVSTNIDKCFLLDFAFSISTINACRLIKIFDAYCFEQ